MELTQLILINLHTNVTTTNDYSTYPFIYFAMSHPPVRQVEQPSEVNFAPVNKWTAEQPLRPSNGSGEEWLTILFFNIFVRSVAEKQSLSKLGKQHPPVSENSKQNLSVKVDKSLSKMMWTFPQLSKRNVARLSWENNSWF